MKQEPPHSLKYNANRAAECGRHSKYGWVSACDQKKEVVFAEENNFSILMTLMILNKMQTGRFRKSFVNRSLFPNPDIHFPETLIVHILVDSHDRMTDHIIVHFKAMLFRVFF